MVTNWDVPFGMRQEYGPEFVEVDVAPSEPRTFLVMLRRARTGETAPDLWTTYHRQLAALEREDEGDGNDP